MGTTKIAWCDLVWNPTTGCTKLGEGCRNCYAARMAKRLAGRCGYPAAPHQFDVTLHPERLGLPLRWKKPSRVFVDSMSDLFHEDVPFWFIGQVFNVMHLAYWHTFQILTKRPERMYEWLGPKYQPNRQAVIPHVWLGVSVENQQTADERIPWLLKTPAAIRFVSVEPMLGRVDLFRATGYMAGINQAPNFSWDVTGISWIICGGESGPGARPMYPDWARSLRDQCQAANVPFFFKQHGEYAESGKSITNEGNWITQNTVMQRVGNKAAGRLLDGKEWHEFPG